MSKTKSTKFTVSVKAATKKFDLVSDIYQRKLEGRSKKNLCLLKTPKGRESLEIFAPPPFRPLSLLSFRVRSRASLELERIALRHQVPS
jgi:hypothetical protein